MRKVSTAEHTIDAVIGRRIFTVCWFCAGLGISILQMLVLSQAWFMSRQAFLPAWLAPG